MDIFSKPRDFIDETINPLEPKKTISRCVAEWI